MARMVSRVRALATLSAVPGDAVAALSVVVGDAMAAVLMRSREPFWEVFFPKIRIGLISD